MTSEVISFTAYLAGTNTSAKCLSVSADGDAKLTLEVSASDLPNVLRMLRYSGKAFKVSVEDVQS